MTLPLPDRVGAHNQRLAIVDPAGEWTFASIDDDAVHLASALEVEHGDRVAVLCTPGHDLVTAVLACWHAGAIAVPLHPPNPDAELAYVLDDSGAAAIVASPAHRDTAARLAAAAGIRVVDVAGSTSGGLLHRLSPRLGHPALMIYTSGTTGRPKGAVHSHRSLAAMVDGMVAAWGWSAADRTVLVLAAEPRPRAHQRVVHGADGRSVLRGSRRVRRVRGLGALQLRRHHHLHGRTDRLRPVDVGVGGRRRRDTGRVGRPAQLGCA